MIFCPPRHGKSEMTTVRYPVWRLKRDPGMSIILGAYNQTLAEKFSRKARRIALADHLPLSAERATAGDWETTAGGGLRAVGVGAGVTGHGGNLIIIDDPVKNREEAESEVYRERCWEWYTDDLYTRLEPGGQMVLIQTRWHHDDLAGRILKSDQASKWTVINLPAEAEENDPLGRAYGEALCPDRYDLKALLDRRETLGNYGYSALFQGRPAPREGGMFKREWFEILPTAPADPNRRVRYWDLAATKDGGDWTVGTLISRHGSIFVINDVRRVQGSPQDVEKLITQTAALDGPTVKIYMEQEPGSSGVVVVEHYARALAGYAFEGIRSTGDKVVRADPLSSQAQVGNVKLVAGTWNEAWLIEAEGFPMGAHDDQVDSASGAFAQIAPPGGIGYASLDDLVNANKPAPADEDAAAYEAALVNNDDAWDDEGG